ncbi:protein GRIP-like [Macadamia integrifolia]|uniref:protein GRIP-like n=1 Tax=Macadamia integrifolia TaxID=60698 RepID=UPI001C4F2E19|nr:protein GRIP-like [Macadamia integrifolia]
MSTQESEINGMPEFHKGVTVKSEEQVSDINHDRDGFLIKGNAVPDRAQYPGCDETHDQLVQMVIELNFQNIYLKAHIEGLKTLQLDSSGICGTKIETEQEGSVTENVKELHEKIESLNRELLEQKQAQDAAEDALKHLRAAYSEADAKAQELSAKLAEVEQKMDQEIKERDEKYNELDSKFGRLHKRAKQRIQEIQKEKDDLEARLHDVNEMAERASSQQTSLQQELERTRHHANESLRTMDVERQQLRTANNKLRETVDEIRRSLGAKENALEGLQQSLFEKEQV